MLKYLLLIALCTIACISRNQCAERELTEEEEMLIDMYREHEQARLEALTESANNTMSYQP